MSLLRRLETLRRFEMPPLPAPGRLRSAVERVHARWPEIIADPPETDRERLVAEMARRLRDDHWEGATLRLATAAARALFDQERRAKATLGSLRDFYYAETRASTNPSFLGAMFSVYLDSYEPGAPHTRALAQSLGGAKAGLGAHAGLIRHLPDLLDPARAPDVVAARMMTMRDPWSELKAIGMPAPHAPGLMDHAHLAYVRRLEPGLSGRTERNRLFAWLRPDGHTARASGASEAITALLKPFEARDPSTEDATHLTEMLVGCYGDPRINPGGAWSGVPRSRLDTLLRWLTRRDISFFLDIVSRVEVSPMWEERRTFWLGLHEQGRIDAAWVALSGAGVKLARKLVAQSPGLSNAFGEQTAGGGRSNTSLLILQVGNRIIVEGSHSYKVHIFSASQRTTPRLYQPTYDCEQIRLIPGSEARAHQGGWQNWVEERI